jgi:hypothetical protein
MHEKKSRDVKVRLCARHAENGVERRAFLGVTGLTDRAPRALGVYVHGFAVLVLGRLHGRTTLVLDELPAIQTATDVFTEALNDAHVLEPAVVLLLTLAGGLANIRLLGRWGRDG